MIRRLFRFALKLCVVAGVGAAVSKVLERRRSAATDWSSSTEPWPPIDVPAATAPDLAPSGPDPAELGQDAEGEATQGGAIVGEEVVASAPRAGGDWIEPDDIGECAPSHPVKAKLGSGVFHLPGMANYERTKADRCYADAAGAEADGLRQAKR